MHVYEPTLPALLASGRLHWCPQQERLRLPPAFWEQSNDILKELLPAR
jgi:hypothetical protein